MSAARATAEATEEKRATVSIEPASDGVVELRLGGTWALGGTRPDAASIASELLGHGARRVVLDASAVESWDSALLAWLRAVEHASTAQGVEVDRARLPEGVGRLLDLAATSLKPPRDGEPPPPLLARIGAAALSSGGAVVGVLGFIGRLVLALGRLLTLRAQMRGPDLARLIQDAGAKAVPITTLVSVIVGVILAFVGSVQLRLFGADLYVADLVAVAMVREMGAMVVGIIMAGRTGAAYAAQLATMNVTEETDALRTFGISTMEFLILPRVVALFLMMPLLCLYSIVLGIFGGAFVGVGLLGISRQLYVSETLQAVALTDLYGGVLHGAVYGLLIGVIGCRRGLSSGRDAGAVGAATTSAVVSSLVAIVVADGVLAVVFDVLKL